MNFSLKILDWYKNNCRDFPWRKTKNPYHILVSEFMLQQTKASKVLKHYSSFIKKFPNLNILSNASEKEVLKEWEGLGLYKRALNLHLFAKKIKKNENFPKNQKKLIIHKGIGLYTSSAVSSICFNEIVPAIDTNVYRVISRYLLCNNSKYSNRRKEIFNFLEKKIDKKFPGIFNQAIMDIGSILCTCKICKCNFCPIKNNCKYKNSDNKKKIEFLLKRNYKKKYKKFYYYLFFNLKNKIFLKKISNKIWNGLYDFPLIISNKYFNIKFIFNKIKVDSYHIIYTRKYIVSNINLLVTFINCKIKKVNEEYILLFLKKNFNEDIFIIPNNKIKFFPFPGPISHFLKYRKIF